MRISEARRGCSQRIASLILEIVCVLAHAFSDAAALPILMAALVALALRWLMAAFTAMLVDRILLLQVVVFFVLAALLCLPRVRMIRGIGRKKGRTGVLILVSLAKSYARIIADEGTAARVQQSEWQGAVDALIANVRGGCIAEGFVAAVDVCGKVLEQRFPRPETSHDELPDRIYVI